MRIIQPSMKPTSRSLDRPIARHALTDEPGSHGLLSRRHFLAATAGAGAVGLGLSAYAFGPAATTVELTRHDLQVPGLAPALRGLRIAHVSDVHLPANEGAVRHALALLEAERPEVVILTGDIVERYQALDVLIEFARRARGTVGTYAVMGNWERAGGVQPEDARRAYAAAGVQFLCNETAMLKVGSGRMRHHTSPAVPLRISCSSISAIAAKSGPAEGGGSRQEPASARATETPALINRRDARSERRRSRAHRRASPSGSQPLAQRP